MMGDVTRWTARLKSRYVKMTSTPGLRRSGRAAPALASKAQTRIVEDVLSKAY